MAAYKLIDNDLMFLYAFQMIGDSMNNGSKWCFEDGDYLKCDEVSVQNIHVGREYVMEIDGVYLVRRVTHIDNQFITVSPLNPSYPKRLLNWDNIKQCFLVKTFQRKIVE